MEYPYSTSTGSITKILEKIQNVGQPSKVDKKWFASIGFSKQSEQRMIFILKFIGFITDDGIPTELWKQFRSRINGKKVLGKALKEAYKELFDIYPNAYEIDKTQLTDFFSTRTTAGKLALTHTVNTFKNLADFANFEIERIDAPVKEKKEDIKKDNVNKTEQPKNTIENNFSKRIESKNGLTINLNIQLTVPETTDEKVYDKFFEALKKHLLS